VSVEESILTGGGVEARGGKKVSLATTKRNTKRPLARDGVKRIALSARDRGVQRHTCSVKHDG